MSDDPKAGQAPGRSIWADLLEAQKEMGNPGLSGTNPRFGSSYTTLADALNAVVPPLNRHGLMLTQPIEGGELVTSVTDAGGRSAELCRYPLDLGGTEQQKGSAITYARRYSVLTAFGLCGEKDDDGNAASERKPEKEAPAKGGGADKKAAGTAKAAGAAKKAAGAGRKAEGPEDNKGPLRGLIGRYARALGQTAAEASGPLDKWMRGRFGAGLKDELTDAQVLEAVKFMEATIEDAPNGH